MSLGLAYWILMLLWLVLSVFHYWPVGFSGALGNSLLLFILLLLIGWQVFGSPLKKG